MKRGYPSLNHAYSPFKLNYANYPFKMLVGWGNAEDSLEEEDSKELQDDDFWGWGGVFPLGNKIYIFTKLLSLFVCLFVCMSNHNS